MSGPLEAPLIYGKAEDFTDDHGEPIEVEVELTIFRCPHCRRVLDGFSPGQPGTHWIVMCRGAEGHAWREAKPA